MQSFERADDGRNEGDDSALPNDKARGGFGSFDLRGAGKRKAPVKIYLLIGVVVFVFFLAMGGIWMFAMSKMKASSHPVDESKVVADATLSAPASQDDAMKQFRLEKLKKLDDEHKKQQAEAKAKQEKEAQSVQNAPPSGALPAAQKGAPPMRTVNASELRKLGGGVMLQTDNEANSQGSANSEAAVPGRSAPARAPSALPVKGEGNRGAAATRGSLNDLGGPGFEPTRAMLAPPRKYLLAHGTYARCALYPEIITEHPGIIDCRLTEPLYSADGSTVISEAGDRMTGVQKVSMVAGQARVFTSWTELETSSGVRANLASLGAGPMGASGTEAWIDNHYLQRYGGAIMLSFIQDALEAASTKAQDSNESGYTVNNTEQNVANMAEKALDSTINIPPTGYILPGTVITVIVARDIDFASVFENQ